MLDEISHHVQHSSANPSRNPREPPTTQQSYGFSGHQTDKPLILETTPPPFLRLNPKHQPMFVFVACSPRLFFDASFDIAVLPDQIFPPVDPQRKKTSRIHRLFALVFFPMAIWPKSFLTNKTNPCNKKMRFNIPGCIFFLGGGQDDLTSIFWHTLNPCNNLGKRSLLQSC